MDQFWAWATVHWWLAFWLMFWFIVGSFSFLGAVFFKLPNRFLRHRNIRARGWPPAHLDADGDFAEEDEDDS